MEILQRWTREPLVLFLILGSVIFVLDRSLRPASNTGNRRIEISLGEVEHLRTLWQAQNRREPTQAELDGLLEELVREEILYREALRLGLDRGDVIVRRRLAQKMTFLLNDTAPLTEPSEEELRSFFAARADDYAEPRRTTLQHIFFSPERRGTPEGDAVAALAELEEATAAGAEAPWRRLGDPFMLHREYAGRRDQELAELFGSAFVTALDDVPQGAWSGPIRSAHGQHLVRIVVRSAARRRSYESVRSRVLEDLRAARLNAAREAAYAELLSAYQLRIEGMEAAAEGPRPSG